MCNFVVHHMIGKKKPLTGLWGWSVQGFCPDKVCWKPVRNKGFEVRGYYSSFYPSTLVSFP